MTEIELGTIMADQPDDLPTPVLFAFWLVTIGTTVAMTILGGLGARLRHLDLLRLWLLRSFNPAFELRPSPDLSAVFV